QILAAQIYAKEVDDCQLEVEDEQPLSAFKNATCSALHACMPEGDVGPKKSAESLPECSKTTSNG
ncbi:hypothetical protein Ancab_014988, partial [Ancistrocladus abbreviatus]